MIRGLYFKLDIDNKCHRFIRQFFDNMKEKGINKVDCLYYLCRMDEAAKKVVEQHNNKIK